MAVDFNPMLARSLANEMNAAEGMYAIGNLLGDKGWYPGKFLAKGVGAVGGAAAGLPGRIGEKMRDDRGLFQGGDKGRIFGRFRDDLGQSFQDAKTSGLLGALFKQKNQKNIDDLVDAGGVDDTTGGGKVGGIPPVGTPERKAYYDSKNWAYDDTIPGYQAAVGAAKAGASAAKNVANKTAANNPLANINPLNANPFMSPYSPLTYMNPFGQISMAKNIINSIQDSKGGNFNPLIPGPGAIAGLAAQYGPKLDEYLSQPPTEPSTSPWHYGDRTKSSWQNFKDDWSKSSSQLTKHAPSLPIGALPMIGPIHAISQMYQAGINPLAGSGGQAFGGGGPTNVGPDVNLAEQSY